LDNINYDLILRENDSLLNHNEKEKILKMYFSKKRYKVFELLGNGVFG
jgi:hypothetical protein